MNPFQEATGNVKAVAPLVYEARLRLRLAGIDDSSLAVFLPREDFAELFGGVLYGLDVVLHEAEDVYVGVHAGRAQVERTWVKP